MIINIERRLQRIKDSLNKGHSALWDMSDDELAQIVSGDPKAKSLNITDAQLETIIREARR